jgi:predicted deacylase
VVIGGVHGDEPAGVEAANAIRDRRIVRGTLLVIPRANEPALQTGARFVAANMHGDLARCFPRSSSDKPRGPLATTLWRMLVQLEPDWLLDLHEGWGVHRRNPATLGSTVLHGPHHLRQAQRMVEAVNATVPRKSDHFVPLQRFIPGSSVHAASQWLGVACLVQETTRVGRDLSTRVRQHVVMTERQLSDLGMVDDSCA